ncbi:MAG: MFS transporter, partial [Erysipelotrichia bacterium]|nr:MFS transporter [Erysipelotrichia bacterium]
AWAAAGLVGPLIISMVKDATGSYSQTLYVFAAFFVVAFIVSIAMIINIKSIQKKKVKHH